MRSYIQELANKFPDLTNAKYSLVELEDQCMVMVELNTGKKIAVFGDPEYVFSEFCPEEGEEFLKTFFNFVEGSSEEELIEKRDEFYEMEEQYKMEEQKEDEEEYKNMRDDIAFDRRMIMNG